MTVKSISPWGNFVIDDSTGMPVTPAEDYFYRVTKVIGGYWEVQLRRKRKGWFSKKEESRTYGLSDPITERTILDGAAHNLTKWYNRDTTPGNKSLIGDYPPKKLEVQK